MMDAFGFLGEIQPNSQQEPWQLGTVAIVSGSNYKIQFDGEESPSDKIYTKISNYNPVKGDRVLLARVRGTYVIIGKVS